MNGIFEHSILIVDDDKNNLLVLNDILESDYRIFTAKSGQSALKIATDLKPSLILLDILMPDMSGFEVLSKLKEVDELKNIPVIFITGLASVEDEAKGFKLGAADYITKPFHNMIVQVRVRNQIQTVDHMRFIEKNAMMDALTGIPNRRSFDKQLELEWACAIRDRTALGLLMLDVDNFKAYNDTFGHPRGDVLLRTLAKTMTSVIKRPADFSARIGGEEFSVILPSTPLDGAAHIAELVRIAIETLAIPHPHSKAMPYVTVSIGVGSVVPTLSGSLSDFIDICDRALYSAKKTGRNRIVSIVEKPDSNLTPIAVL